MIDSITLTQDYIWLCEAVSFAPALDSISGEMANKCQKVVVMNKPNYRWLKGPSYQRHSYVLLFVPCIPILSIGVISCSSYVKKLQSFKSKSFNEIKPEYTRRRSMRDAHVTYACWGTVPAILLHSYLAATIWVNNLGIYCYWGSCQVSWMKWANFEPIQILPAYFKCEQWNHHKSGLGF